MKKELYFLLISVFFSFSFLNAQNNTLDFDGTNDIVLVSNYTGSGTTVTVEAWVYAESRPQWGIIAANWGGATTGEFHFGLYDNSGYLGAQITQSNGVTVSIVETGVLFSLNSWQHITLIADGTNLYLLRNGAIVAGPVAYNGTLKNTFQHLGIGAKPSDAGGYEAYTWNGKIDEVRIWSDARTQAEIRANIYKELVGNETNLVAYYKFNETSGTTADNAEGTAGIDGTLTNMAGTEWTPSSAFFGSKNTLDFDGTNDYVSIPDDNTLDFATANDYTIEAWIYPRSFGFLDGIVSKYHTPSANGYMIRLSSTSPYTGLQFNEVSTNNGILSANTWYHIAGVNDGGSLTVYLNGIEQSLSGTALQVAFNNDPVRIGVDYLDAPRFFDGQIDEVRIWNVVRTEAEIRENMNKSLIGNETGLVAYYNFDNALGTSLQDYSGNTNDGTLTNMDAATDWVASTAFNTWLNTDNSDWATASNWSNGLPVSTDNVGIPNFTGASQPTIGSNVTWNHLVIDTLSTLTIGSNTITNNGNMFNFGTIAGSGNMTNNGIIINENIMTFNNLTSSSGTFTINSDSETISGSLIVNGTPTGSFTYNRYMVGDQWHMLGSPLSGQTINSTFLTNNSLSGMKHYIESPEAWSTDYATTAPDVAFSLGQGYATKRSTDGLVSLTGTLNNATKAVTLTRGEKGWNLLSNPFTSAIAATVTGDATNNLLTVNTATLDPNFAALYVWVENIGDPTNTNNYKTINNGGGTLSQDYLQVGQGFFVRSKIGGGSFSITPAMQSHQTAIAFKSEETPWARITLNAEISNAKASTNISYHEGMTRGLDVTYDGGLLNSYPDFALYTRLVEDNGVDFAVQCLPTDYEELVVPVGLDAKVGDLVSFSADAINIPEDYAVVLEDRTSNTFTDLSEEGAEYAIQLTDDSDGIGRFFVHTVIQSALGLDDLETENTFQVFTRPINHQLVIRGEANSNTTARIYSITGKLIVTANLLQATENSIRFNEEAGIYIVQIVDKNGTFTQKFAWVK